MNQAHVIINDAPLLEGLKDLMWKAGDAIMGVYQSVDFGTETKGDDSPVTKADLAAHNVLVQGLSELTPTIPVVSEEDAESIKIGQTAEIYWLIDPLDGTKEFIKRNGEFTCNLALIESKRTTLGFVGVPAAGHLYVGGTDITATMEDQTGSSTSIYHVYESEVTRIVASKSHLNEETQNFIDDIDGEIQLIQAGSSLKFLKIATGEADIYPRLAPTCEWDTAAAHAVLNGAGGEVFQTNGDPLAYGKSDILNPHFIAKAIDC